MGEYGSGLCACFDDCGICVISYFCPCYQIGLNQGAVDGSGGVNFLYCLASLFFAPCVIFVIRSSVQEKYGIEEGIVGKVIASFCCAICAVTQDARELKKQGALK